MTKNYSLEISSERIRSRDYEDFYANYLDIIFAIKNLKFEQSIVLTFPDENHVDYKDRNFPEDLKYVRSRIWYGSKKGYLPNVEQSYKHVNKVWKLIIQLKRIKEDEKITEEKK